MLISSQLNTTTVSFFIGPHLSVVVTGSPCVPLSGMLSYSILFDSMKFFCIADIWAIIFCRWSLAASAFLLRSAFSLSWALWNNNKPDCKTSQYWQDTQCNKVFVISYNFSRKAQLMASLCLAPWTKILFNQWLVFVKYPDIQYNKSAQRVKSSQMYC